MNTYSLDRVGGGQAFDVKIFSSLGVEVLTKEMSLKITNIPPEVMLLQDVINHEFKFSKIYKKNKWKICHWHLIKNY